MVVARKATLAVASDELAPVAPQVVMPDAPRPLVRGIGNGARISAPKADAAEEPGHLRTLCHHFSPTPWPGLRGSGGLVRGALEH